MRAIDLISPLRRLTRYRFHIVKAINREKPYFLTHLRLKFLGFSVEKPFASLFGATSLALICEFSPNELVNLYLEDLTKFIIKNGKNRFREPDKMVETLKRTAQEYCRLRPALSSSINLILTTIHSEGIRRSPARGG